MNLFKKFNFPSLKITVDTLIYVRNETSKHHFLKSVKNKHITLLSDAYFPVHVRAQQRTKCNLLQLTANCIAATRCLRHYIKMILRISNHRGHKFPPSLTLLSFKTRIEWPPMLTATANFPSVLFQLLKYPRQRPSFSGHRAALMTITVSILPAFFSRFVDFAVQFCFHCKFSFHEGRGATLESSSPSGMIFLDQSKFFCYDSKQWDCFICIDNRLC